MGIINITSDRKNVTLDSDMILYIIMHGKIAEIHIVGGRVYETRVALNNCASHSRYFSDELDTQIFYSKKEHMFTFSAICAKI